MIDAKAVATNPSDRKAQGKLRDSTRKVNKFVVKNGDIPETVVFSYDCVSICWGKNLV